MSRQTRLIAFQAFFARVLERNYLHAVQPGRGKFRWFLLASLRHFLANEWDRATAEKRGGSQRHISIDELTAEDLYRREPTHALTAQECYERTWALTLLEKARVGLQVEFTAAGKTERFGVLE
jgi:hypothetical protein